MVAAPPPMELQCSQAPVKEERLGLHVKPPTGKRSVRSTRSQAVPNWSLQELLFLVNEISAIESDFMHSLSSYQKWKIVADNCTSLGVVRSLNQCRRQWDMLLDEYKTVKDWESQTGVSYWSLDRETLVELGLPLSFNRELFIFIDDNVQAQEDKSGMDTDTDPDFKVIPASGSKKKRRCQRPRKIKNEQGMSVELPEQDATRNYIGTKRKTRCERPPTERKNEEQETAVKLREQADLIHAILEGTSVCNSNDVIIPVVNHLELRRWQGNELIKVLGDLVGTLDQLSELIQEG